MIKSKILYGLCIAALGLPFAEASKIISNEGDGNRISYRTQYSNFGKQNPGLEVCNNESTFGPLLDALKGNGLSPITGNKRQASPDECQKKKEKNNSTNILKPVIKNWQQLNDLSKSAYDLIEDLRNELAKNAQKIKVNNSHEYTKKYVEQNVNILTYLTVYGGTYDEIKATLERIFGRSTAEKYTPYMHGQILGKVGGCRLLCTDLSCLFAGRDKEFIRKEVCGYNITNDRARELLNAIGNPSYDKNKRKKLENELQALGVCRTSKWLRNGDKLLEIQLEAFLDPNKHKDNPRNAYNELVLKAGRRNRLTAKEKEGVDYLISVGGENKEIRGTFKNVFMRDLKNRSISNRRNNVNNGAVACEKSFDEIAANLKLTASDKKRLLNDIRGYKITNELAVRLLWCIDTSSDMLGKYSRKDLKNELQALGVLNINEGTDDNLLKKQLNELLGGDIYENWLKNDYGEPVMETEAGEGLIPEEKEALEYLISVGGENREICDTFRNVFRRTISDESIRKRRNKVKEGAVACEKSFDKIAANLKLTASDKKRLLNDIRGYNINIKKLAAFLSKGGYEYDEILSIFEILYNKTYCPQTISEWKQEKSSPEGLSSEQPEVSSGIFGISPATLTKELYDLGFCQAFVDYGVDEAQCKRFKELLENSEVEVQEEDDAGARMEIKQDNDDLIGNDNIDSDDYSETELVEQEYNDSICNDNINNIRNDYENSATETEYEENNDYSETWSESDKEGDNYSSETELESDQEDSNDYINNDVMEIESNNDNNASDNNLNNNSVENIDNNAQVILNYNLQTNNNCQQDMTNKQINTGFEWDKHSIYCDRTNNVMAFEFDSHYNDRNYGAGMDDNNDERISFCQQLNDCSIDDDFIKDVITDQAPARSQLDGGNINNNQNDRTDDSSETWSELDLEDNDGYSETESESDKEGDNYSSETELESDQEDSNDYINNDVMEIESNNDNNTSNNNLNNNSVGNIDSNAQELFNSNQQTRSNCQQIIPSNQVTAHSQLDEIQMTIAKNYIDITNDVITITSDKVVNDSNYSRIGKNLNQVNWNDVCIQYPVKNKIKGGNSVMTISRDKSHPQWNGIYMTLAQNTINITNNVITLNNNSGNNLYEFEIGEEFLLKWGNEWIRTTNEINRRGDVITIKPNNF